MAKANKHTVTNEDLENNPELAAQGIKEGDQIELPANDAVSRADFEALQAKYEALQKQVAKLAAAAPAEKKQEVKPAIPDKTFKVDGKEYRFKFAQFVIPGIGRRTAAEALTDKDLLKKLVESNSGLIKRDF